MRCFLAARLLHLRKWKVAKKKNTTRHTHVAVSMQHINVMLFMIEEIFDKMQTKNVLLIHLNIYFFKSFIWFFNKINHLPVELSAYWDCIRNGIRLWIRAFMFEVFKLIQCIISMCWWTTAVKMQHKFNTSNNLAYAIFVHQTMHKLCDDVSAIKKFTTKKEQQLGNFPVMIFKNLCCVAPIFIGNNNKRVA